MIKPVQPTNADAVPEQAREISVKRLKKPSLQTKKSKSKSRRPLKSLPPVKRARAPRLEDKNVQTARNAKNWKVFSAKRKAKSSRLPSLLQLPSWQT